MTTRDLAICSWLLKLFLCTLMFSVSSELSMQYWDALFDATVLKSFLSNVGWMFGRLVYLLRMYFSGTLAALIVCIMHRTCTQKRPVLFLEEVHVFFHFIRTKTLQKN